MAFFDLDRMCELPRGSGDDLCPHVLTERPSSGVGVIND